MGQEVKEKKERNEYGKIRVSYNLKLHERVLIKYACKVLEEDMSRLIAQAILYKYQWLDADACKEWNQEHWTEINYGKCKSLKPIPKKANK